MEKHIKSQFKKEDVEKLETNHNDEYENLSDNEDIDIENLTSNKVAKSIDTSKLGKKLYVILEHA